jgi:hypothetical protein
MDSEPVKKVKLQAAFEDGLHKQRDLEKMIIEAGME